MTSTIKKKKKRQTPKYKRIQNNRDYEVNFEFEKVTPEKVDKIMNKIGIKHTTGVDGIPAKLMKQSKSVMGPQITTDL